MNRYTRVTYEQPLSPEGYNYCPCCKHLMHDGIQVSCAHTENEADALDERVRKETKAPTREAREAMQKRLAFSKGQKKLLGER